MDGSSIALADAGVQAPLYNQFWDHNRVKSPMVMKILSQSKCSFKHTGTGLGSLMWYQNLKLQMGGTDIMIS